jgi:hypothetical protein
MDQRRRHPPAHRAGLWGLLALVISAGVVRATVTDAEKLPLTVRFGCLNCHQIAEPTAADHRLNAFGADFLANDRIWNETLAQLDSDGDGCLNGVELGDSDGDGIADGHVVEEAGNPGVADDCSGPTLDEATWGTLKAIFDR